MVEKTSERVRSLFAESGYDGTSVRAIVAKAKVNQAAINYHFEGKDGLYREVRTRAAGSGQPGGCGPKASGCGPATLGCSAA